MCDDEFGLDDIDNAACLSVEFNDSGKNSVTEAELVGGAQEKSSSDAAVVRKETARDTEVANASHDREKINTNASAVMRGEGEVIEKESNAVKANEASSRRKTSPRHKDSSDDETGDEGDSGVLTIEEYRKLFVRQNKQFGLTKIRNSSPEMRFVRPRVRLPNTGPPVIFVCEGVQAVAVREGLICPGRTFFLQNKIDKTKREYVVIGCIWVHKPTRYAHSHSFIT